MVQAAFRAALARLLQRFPLSLWHCSYKDAPGFRTHGCLLFTQAICSSDELHFSMHPVSSYEEIQKICQREIDPEAEASGASSYANSNSRQGYSPG